MRVTPNAAGLELDRQSPVELELAVARHVVVLELDEVLEAGRERERQPSHERDATLHQGVGFIIEPERGRIHAAGEEVQGDAATDIGPRAGRADYNVSGSEAV